MAEHVHKSYSCDRCKAELGDKRPDRTRVVRVQARLDWKDSQGSVFDWADLCDDCYFACLAFFERGDTVTFPSNVSDGISQVRALLDRCGADGAAVKLIRRMAWAFGLLKTRKEG